jgi:hypothetical protein
MARSKISPVLPGVDGNLLLAGLSGFFQYLDAVEVKA